MAHPPVPPCREFVRTKLAGLLQVAVRRAVSPPAAEARSALSPGPQLRLSVGGSSWSSIVAVNNPNPDWEEQCTLYIRCAAGAAAAPRRLPPASRLHARGLLTPGGPRGLLQSG